MLASLRHPAAVAPDVARRRCAQSAASSCRSHSCRRRSHGASATRLTAAMETADEAEGGRAPAASPATPDRRSDDAPVGHGDARLRDCHGGDPEVSVAAGLPIGLGGIQGGEEEGASAAARSGSVEDARRTPSAPTPMAARNRRSSSGSSTPATSASPTSTCGSCHAAEVQQRPHEHDDARRDALGGGALQQRRRCPSRTPRFGESYGRTARRSACRRARRRRAEETRRRACCRSSIRCRAGR